MLLKVKERLFYGSTGAASVCRKASCMLFLEEQALFLTDCGEEYGPRGEGFTRMNLATPCAEVKKALEYLLSAAKENGFAR